MGYLVFILIFILPISLVVGFIFGVMVIYIGKWVGLLNRWWFWVVDGLILIAILGSVYWLLDTGLFLDEIEAKKQMAEICDKKNASTKVIGKEAWGKTVEILDKEYQLDTAIPVTHYESNYVDASTGQLYFIGDMYIAEPGWFGRLLAKHAFYEESFGPMTFEHRICKPDVLKFDEKELKEKYQITRIEE